MTHDEMIAVIQAAKEGKKIQASNLEDGAWLDCITPCFDFSHFEYRVKPEPREIWVNEYGEGFGSAIYRTKEEACDSAGAQRIRVVRFREVIE